MSEGEAQNSVQSQASFESTPYEDATWEVVSELEGNQDFQPLSMEALKSDEMMVDPMFANYGGVATEAVARRWHLPEHLAHTDFSGKETVTEQPPGTTALTDEQIEQIRNEAREEGRRESAEALAEQNVTKMGALEQRLGTLLRDLTAQLTTHRAEVEKAAVELSIVISKKIIDSAVEINPEYVIDIVRQAIALSGAATVKKVRVSPQDLEFIEVVGVARSIKEYDGSWNFEADPSVRAGCIVESSAGEVDFRIDEAWERVRDQVVRIVR